MSQGIPYKAEIPEHWLHWTFFLPELLIAPLSTVDRQTVKIIDSGQLNFDNGPDVRNATLQINGVLQKGDIEFHLNPKDWFGHGHHEDRRYQNIILHVLWEASLEIDQRLRQRFPHLILKHQIRIPYSEWVERMLMLDANEIHKTQIIPERLTPALLKQWGQKRFERKAERFKYWLQQFTIEDAFIISLAEAMGYSKNKFPFRQLLWETPPSKIFQTLPKFYNSSLGIWVYLALRANLLTAHSFTHLKRQHNPIHEKIYYLFQYFSREGALPVLHLSDWYFSRVRPANNPVIRLAALAQIIFQHQHPTLFKKMLQSAMDRLPPKELLIAWQADLQLAFNAQVSKALETIYKLPVAMRHTIGTTRMKQFIINSVFPLFYLWAERHQNHGFQQYIMGLYEGFPACEDARLLNRTASGAACKQVFNKLAIYQQGLLELTARQPAGGRLHFNPSNRVNVK